MDTPNRSWKKTRYALIGVAIALLVGPTLAQAATANDAPSLIAAIDAATGPTTITLTANIPLASTLMIPSGKTITLEGPHTLTGASGPTITNTGNLTIDGITVTHSTGIRGCGINNTGTLTLASGSITNNTTNVYLGGGGVFNAGIFTMSGGSITNNATLAYGSFVTYGGGVYNTTGSTFYLTDGDISDNVANHAGGGICNGIEVTCTMTGGSITHNTAGSYGGGVVHGGLGVFTMTGGKISENFVPMDGGGIYNGNGGIMYMSGNAEISENRARRGAGILNRGILELNDDMLICDNIATEFGGGINNENGNDTVTMNGGTITRNTAEYGGGVATSGSETDYFKMNDGVISENTAELLGGGICVLGGSTYINGGSTTENDAPGGGGIYSQGFLTISGGTVSENTATNGGGVYTIRVFTLTDTGAITDNRAEAGGGVYCYQRGNVPTTTITSGTIAGNTASTDGGGVYIPYNILSRLTVGASAVFSNNKAQAAYTRNPVDDALYYANIFGTSWTDPFTQGYNNFDISYTNGTQISTYSVTFDPGAHGTFAPVTHTGLFIGQATPTPPDPVGVPGWVFAGWSPPLTDLVEGDQTYVALWTEQIDPPPVDPGTPEGPSGPSTPPMGDISRFAILSALLLLGMGSASIIVAQKQTR